MRTVTTLVEHNLIALKQGVDLLNALSDASYRHTSPPIYDSSIGAHLRHVLEHYVCLLQGAPSHAIDYDGRDRDRRIEHDRAFALGVTGEITQGLHVLGADDFPVRVKMTSDPRVEVAWTDSTLLRELQYVQAHTIHHFALIAMMVRMQGHEPPPDFGVAPSTLAYRMHTAAAPR